MVNGAGSGGGGVASNHGRSKSARMPREGQRGRATYVEGRGEESDGGGSPRAGGGGSGEDAFTLPPLTKSAKAAEALDSLFLDAGDGASPTKRGRKKSLAAYSEGAARSLIQTSLDIDMREKELALMRASRQEYGRLLVEMWVNQVLDPGGTDPHDTRTHAMQPDVTTMKGLASFGLTRVELLGAGLSHGAVDRLYRGLYVYTIGFFDVMQDILEHSEFRLELLSNVWRAYLFIAEAAMKVAFKGDFLQLFQAQQITAAELLVTKEALAEATKDAHQTEKALAWLTAAHAEERALRVTARAEAAAAVDQLSGEQAAHQAAVSRLVAEMEAKARLGLELEALQAKLQEAAGAHADLVAQRDLLTEDRDSLQDKCMHVLADVLETYQALAMEDALDIPPEMRRAVEEAEAQDAQAGEGRLGLASLKAKSSLARELTTQLYSLWRSEVAEHAGTKRELFGAKDTARASRMALLEAQEDVKSLRDQLEQRTKVLEARERELQDTQVTLDSTRATLEQTRNAQLLAEEEVGRLKVHVQGLEALLLNTGQERDTLNTTCEAQAVELQQVHARADQLAQQLAHSEWLVQQLSRGFAVTMRALRTNQSARRVLQRNLVKARQDTAVAQKQQMATERTVRVLEGKLDSVSQENQELCSQLTLSEQAVAEGNTALDAATKKVESQAEDLRQYGLRVTHLDAKVAALETNLERTTKLLTGTEEALGTEREEVARLYAGMQALEKSLRESADERARLVKKVEQAKAETATVEEKCKRREATLNLEIKRLQSEVRLERSRVQSAELQIEALRKSLSEASDQLARKRQKKRKWKKGCLDGRTELEFVRAQLQTAREGVGALEQRLAPLEVDLALLMADRGRPLPADAVKLLASSQPPPPAHPAHPASRSTSVHRTASRGATLNAATSMKQGLYEGTQIPGDMLPVYTEWDKCNQQALDAQLQLDQHSKDVDAARRQYERSRAIYYTNPGDKTLQERMVLREQELTAARQRRAELEQQLEARSQKIRDLQAQIHEYESSTMKARMEALVQRTGKQELELRSELSLRVDESDGRARELGRLLEEQLTAYDMLVASRKHLEGECARIEEELRKLSAKLETSVADRIELEESLRTARGQVTYLQEQLLQLTRDNDALHLQIQAGDDKISSLHAELSATLSSVELKLQRAEAKLEEEKRAAVAAVVHEKQEICLQLAHKQEVIDELTATKKRLQDDMRGILTLHYDEQEEARQPVFMFCVRPRPVVASAEALVPDFTRPTNISLADPVVQFLAPSYETLLIMISQLYTTKILHDWQQEEHLLGGRVGVRCELEGLVYDWFMARYGTRQATELHLSAFLWAVQKYRLQHPKIRVFSRLIGMQDPLPKPAQEFYCALLNRIHARAGPLVSEAAEGQSVAKCRVVAKAARELLRGSYANINSDAASLTDTLKGMAMGDEEAPVEVDVAAELALKAWWQQFSMDVDALEVGLRGSCPPRDLTPDDLLSFLRTIDAGKAEEMAQEGLLTMYRHAAREAGPQPQPGAARRALATAILESGFVGMCGHQARLEPVRSPPPYDEFMLLEESWRAMRVVVEQQLTILEAHPELRADVQGVVDTARKLDLALEGRENPSLPWALYRRLVVLYLLYRKPAERFGDFKPPAGSAAASIFTRPPSPQEDPAAAAIAAAELNAAAAKAAATQKLHHRPRRHKSARSKRSLGGAADATYSFSRRSSRSNAGSETDGDGVEAEDSTVAPEKRVSAMLKPRSRSASPDRQGGGEAERQEEEAEGQGHSEGGGKGSDSVGEEQQGQEPVADVPADA